MALRGEIGGDIVSMRSRDPARLASSIREKLGEEPQVVDGTVRLSKERGHEFVVRLVESFPGLIDSVTVAKPSLEDVFLAKTREIWS